MYKKVASSNSTLVDKKVLTVGLLGNCLEFYDLGLCGFLAPSITPFFFPSNDPFSLFLASMALFSIGFVMRPIGAIIFGYIGDALGRKISLSTTMLMMAIPTLLIALMPTIEQIGILAPILFVACRMMQGICVGGECNNAAIYLLECTKQERRGLISGIITASSNFGFFLASIMALLCGWLPYPNFSWRIPFVLGALVGFLGFYLRRKHVIESPAFRKPNSEIIAWKFMKTQARGLIIILFLGFFAGTLCLTLVGYLPSYLHLIADLPKDQASHITNIGLLFFMFLLPVTGYCSDRFGKHRLMLGSSILALCLSYVIFCLLNSGDNLSILIGVLLLSAITALYMGPMHAYTLTIFTPEARCRGISIAFAAGVGILGGTMPIISTYLIKWFEFNEAPAIYMSLSALAGIFSILLESSKKRLSTDISNELETTF